MSPAVDTAEHPASRSSADAGGLDPPQRSAETTCVDGGSESVACSVHRRKKVSQTKRHSNVFLKHKLKYKKKSSAHEDSSSSTESERATPVSGPLRVTFLPGAVAGDCCNELYRCGSSTLVPSGDGLAQQASVELAGATATLLPADAAAPHGCAATATTVTAAQAASGEPSLPFFKSIPSVSSTLSSTSSRSSGASAEKDGSDSSDSLASATATQRRSLKRSSTAAEKEGSDSSDSPASGASATRKTIKKLIRNKYDIFRRHKLKYRRLLGKSDGGRVDLQLDNTDGYDDEDEGGTAAAPLITVRCPANGSRGCSAESSSSGGSGSSSGDGGRCASGAVTSGAAGTCGHHQALQLPGPRGLPHNPLLHSSSGSSRSSSSMQSSSSSSSSSVRRPRDAGLADKGKELLRASSPAVINRVVPLMVMVQRQMVAGDASSAALMFKCNMCNMFSSVMRNVLVHISERHATAQYCFDCESFFPDTHSLDSHRAVGCQGQCSVSRAGSVGGSDAAPTDEATDSPQSSASGACRKGGEAEFEVGGAGGSGMSGDVSIRADTIRSSAALPEGKSDSGGSVVSCHHGGVGGEQTAVGLLPPCQLARCQQAEQHEVSAYTNGRCADLALSSCSSASLGSLASLASSKTASASGSSSAGEGSSSTFASSLSASSCSSSLSSKLPVISEVGAEAGKEHRCRLCSKEFLGSCYLKRHMRSHTGEKICFCPTCRRGFSEWRNLRNHIARFHGRGSGSSHGSSQSASSDSCSGASAVASSTSGFSEGLPGGELPPYAAANSVGSPEEPMEDAERLLACSLDAAVVAAQDSTGAAGLDTADSDLLLHSTMHLGSTSSRLELNSDETFRRKALTPHDRAGGLRRTYHCEPCNKDFVTKFAMQRHLDFHADKRPFHCDMCSYKSKTKPQLKVHQMRHKGQKVYHCDLCNYDCVTHSDLNRHCKSMSHKSRHSSNMLSPS